MDKIIGRQHMGAVQALGRMLRPKGDVVTVASTPSMRPVKGAQADVIIVDDLVDDELTTTCGGHIPYDPTMMTPKLDGMRTGELNFIMGGRRCGKSALSRRAFLLWMDEQSRHVKGHHRCYCGSGKLRKNCCNKRLPSQPCY